MLWSLLLSTALPQVSVDWSEVPDAVIARCDLSGLETMVLQGMVDEGYAVVREVPPDGIALTIRADDTRFEIEGRRGERRSQVVVPIPRPCDATIQIEILSRMHEVSDALGVETALPPAGTSTATEREPPVSAAPADWRISAGVGAVLPSATGMFAIRAGVRRRIVDAWSAGLVLEGSVRPARGVTVFEPVVAAQAVLELWSSRSGIAVLAGVEAGLLAHLFSREGARGGHLDGRFGLILEGRLPVLGATLLVLPYLRLRPVRQDVGPDTVFEAHHFGVVIALSMSIDL